MDYVLLFQVILLQLWYAKCSPNHIENIPICTSGSDQHQQPPEVHLTAHGIGASVYVQLRDSEPDAHSASIEGHAQWPQRGRVKQNQQICRLKVTAPPGHVVYVKVMETRLEIHRALIVHHSEREVKCPLNIFLPDTKSEPFYTANMCDVESVADVPLVPSELELAWKPPLRSDNSEIEMLTKDRMLLISAVGQEATCQSPANAEERNKYHTCMKIGWKPMLCVSKDLICNGQTNCPKGSTSSDEAETICRARQSFEDIARRFIQEFQIPLGFNEKWVESAKKQIDPTTTTENTVANRIVSILKKIEATTRKPAYHHPNDPVHSKTQPAATTDSTTLTISSILNQYGPWGYLMLGMLICGGILLLCGMWECCCRRPKPFLGSSGGHRGSTVGHRSSGGPTVLIIDHGDESGGTGRPPEYDELDQPPLYSVLFPNNKVNAPDVAVIQMQERRPSQEELAAQQSSHLSRQNSTVVRGEVIPTSHTVSISVPKDENDQQNQNSASNSNNVESTRENVDDNSATSTGTTADCAASVQ